MTRIVQGKIVTDDDDLGRYGPFRFIILFIRSVVAFIQLFFQSIFNPRALSGASYRRPGGGGSGGGPRKPTIVHGIKPTENCRAGS